MEESRRRRESVEALNQSHTSNKKMVLWLSRYISRDKDALHTKANVKAVKTRPPLLGTSGSRPQTNLIRPSLTELNVEPDNGDKNRRNHWGRAAWACGGKCACYLWHLHHKIFH
ncbi:hypothetical protein BaRGS_00028384 [Batillaria attramentaria]|uniref:Uncharacterized protein n=1 Tax=Batillaria attramentaria TaxID=370345 RepID=A0ABD0JZ46_9CAEN